VIFFCLQTTLSSFQQPLLACHHAVDSTRPNLTGIHSTFLSLKLLVTIGKTSIQGKYAMHFSTLRLGASILVHFRARLFDWKALLRTQKRVDVHPLISLVGCFGLFNGDRGLSFPCRMTRHLGDSCRLVSTRSLYTCKNLEKLARRVDHSTWNLLEKQLESLNSRIPCLRLLPTLRSFSRNSSAKRPSVIHCSNFCVRVLQPP
jgi:hypothetical protein